MQGFKLNHVSKKDHRSSGDITLPGNNLYHFTVDEKKPDANVHLSIFENTSVSNMLIGVFA